MKRKTILLIVVVLMCVSCAPFDISDEATGVDSVPFDTNSSIENGYLSDKTVLFETSAVLENGMTTNVYIIVDKDYAAKYWVDVNLYAQISGKDVLHNVGNYESHSVADGKLLAYDIDGDGSDELLLNMEITGNGGTITCVYDYAENGFEKVYDFDDHTPQFKCENISDRRVNVTSTKPAFSHTVFLSDIFGDNISNLTFDPDGVAQHTFYASADPIYDVSIKDGKIVCTMPLEIEREYCFDVRQYLEYDASHQQFIILGYEFVSINSAR